MKKTLTLLTLLSLSSAYAAESKVNPTPNIYIETNNDAGLESIMNMTIGRFSEIGLGERIREMYNDGVAERVYEYEMSAEGALFYTNYYCSSCSDFVDDSLQKDIHKIKKAGHKILGFKINLTETSYKISAYLIGKDEGLIEENASRYTLISGGNTAIDSFKIMSIEIDNNYDLQNYESWKLDFLKGTLKFGLHTPSKHMLSLIVGANIGLKGISGKDINYYGLNVGAKAGLVYDYNGSDGRNEPNLRLSSQLEKNNNFYSKKDSNKKINSLSRNTLDWNSQLDGSLKTDFGPLKRTGVRIDAKMPLVDSESRVEGNEFNYVDLKGLEVGAKVYVQF